MSTVTVIKSSKGVINAATNPLEGWVAMKQVGTNWSAVEGRPIVSTRTGFLRNKLEWLNTFNVRKELAELQALGVDCSGIKVVQEIGLAEGQQLPGRIVIKDQIKPILAGDATKGIAPNPSFGLRVPQQAATADMRKLIRDKATSEGLCYMWLDEQGTLHNIYRKTFYSPFPAGHPNYVADNILPVGNQAQVNAFIASVISQNNPSTGLAASRAARIAAIKAIAKNKRTPEQVAELADLLED